MSQRNSDYERKPYDLYETPEWVTEALCNFVPVSTNGPVWEPAAASGKIVRVIEARGTNVVATDILGSDPTDFLGVTSLPGACKTIVTNPPYGPRGTLAHKFIRHALELTAKRRGRVAMLLRVDFDSAKTRADVFGNHPAFARKIVLRKRIQWFGKGKNGSSENHAWFVWDWNHRGSPTIGYAP